METLPVEVLRTHILMSLLGYAPVLRSVCRVWRDVVRAAPEFDRLMAIWGAAEGIHGLARQGYLNVIYWLVGQQKTPFSSSRMQNILDAASAEGQIACMEFAMAWAAMPSDLDKALCIAATCAQLRAVELLRARGAQTCQYSIEEAGRAENMTILEALTRPVARHLSGFQPNAPHGWKV